MFVTPTTAAITDSYRSVSIVTLPGRCASELKRHRAKCYSFGACSRFQMRCERRERRTRTRQRRKHVVALLPWRRASTICPLSFSNDNSLSLTRACGTIHPGNEQTEETEKKNRMQLHFMVFDFLLLILIFVFIVVSGIYLWFYFDIHEDMPFSGRT